MVGGGWWDIGVIVRKFAGRFGKEGRAVVYGKQRSWH